MQQIKLKPRIAEHDLNVKIKNARRILLKGKDDVLVSLMFRGREITHPDIGVKILDKFVDGTSDIASVSSRTIKGNIYSLVLRLRRTEVEN